MEQEEVVREELKKISPFSGLVVIHLGSAIRMSMEAKMPISDFFMVVNLLWDTIEQIGMERYQKLSGELLQDMGKEAMESSLEANKETKNDT